MKRIKIIFYVIIAIIIIYIACDAKNYGHLYSVTSYQVRVLKEFIRQYGRMPLSEEECIEKGLLRLIKDSEGEYYKSIVTDARFIPSALYSSSCFS